MGKKRIATKSGAPSATRTGRAGSQKAPKKTVLKGIINVFSTYNNTIVSIAQSDGQILTWSSAGSLGFKGTKKSTPYAATLVAKDVLEKAKRFGFQEARIIVKGIGPGREGAIRGIASSDVNILSIIDNTPQPHNGVKAPKPRRV
jgi:small subunit ribosomal protein S11